MNTILFYVFISYILTFFSLITKNELFNALAQTTPSLATVLIIVFSHQRILNIKNLGIFKIGKMHYYLLAIMLPFLAIAFSFAGSTLLAFTQFTPLLDFKTFIAHYFLLIFMWPLLWAFTEEIGWRGFLQPKLIKRCGVEKGIFYTGIIWSVWHYLFIFTGNYYFGGNLYLNILLFTTAIIFMSFTIGWLRLVSKSIWPCVFFHSASNAALQMLSPQWKILNANYIYIAGEAGIGNIIFWGLAFLLIRKLEPVVN